MYFPLKGERKLSLLVDNSGRVNCGKLLDEQRKGNSIVLPTVSGSVIALWLYN